MRNKFYMTNPFNFPTLMWNIKQIVCTKENYSTQIVLYLRCIYSLESTKECLNSITKMFPSIQNFCYNIYTFEIQRIAWIIRLCYLWILCWIYVIRFVSASVWKCFSEQIVSFLSAITYENFYCFFTVEC